MYTQCPICRKTYPLTKKQLRAKKSKIFCADCKKKFNAHELLNPSSLALVSPVNAEYRSGEASEPLPRDSKPVDIVPFPADISGFLRNRIEDADAGQKIESDQWIEKLPWEIEQTPLPVNWLAVCIAGVILLIAQVIFFETGKLVQNGAYRPKIETMAQWIGYDVPVYVNLQEFEVLQSSLDRENDGSYHFGAAISNQAAFKQRLPSIKLSLLDLNEQVFAERIFPPGVYLPATKKTEMYIAPDETIQANVKIAAPETPVGGYHFDLIY